MTKAASMTMPAVTARLIPGCAAAAPHTASSDMPMADHTVLLLAAVFGGSALRVTGTSTGCASGAAGAAVAGVAAARTTTMRPARRFIHLPQAAAIFTS